MTEAFPPFALHQYIKPAATLAVGFVATLVLYVSALFEVAYNSRVMITNF